MSTSNRKRFPMSVPGEPERPRLLEFLALHAGIGAAMGIVMAGIVVMSNLGGIRGLLKESSEPYIPMILFFASFALTFASAKMGIAVMSLPLEAPDPADDDKTGVADPSAPAAPDALPEPTDATANPADGSNRLLGRRE